MKYILFLTLFALSNLAFGQATFTIDGFSDGYYGKVSINDTAEVFSPGWTAVYDKKTNKEIIKVEADELSLSLHDGQAIANVKSLPYGEQSVLMYEDFNFDGKKDFAVMDGQNSCYHGPSFKIYLAVDNGFIFNEAFTRLAQEYCGMFQVDHEQKKISTMTKSGCCWHEFSEFVVEGNKPKAVKIITEEYSVPFVSLTTETWNGKKMVKETTRNIDLQEVKVILSFTVPEKQKQAVLFNLNDRMLYYALLRKDSTVEFCYPIEAVYQSPDFTFKKNPGNCSVTFKNENATYIIYDNPLTLGIDVLINGKLYKWIGDPKTKQGNLTDLTKVKLDNVVEK